MVLNLAVISCKIDIASPTKDLKEEIIKEITKRILQNRYGFSRKQVNDLFSTQKNGSTFEEPLPCNRDDKLSIRDVRAEAYALALSAKNANAGSSRLTRLRRELRNLSASLEIIEITKFLDITKDANKIQSVLESVKERLNAYDIKTLSNCQALADVMVMLCIRPAELKTYALQMLE
ncbi:2269_t:CDS:2 [Dentiscutata erythropus]|uniref:2269_t:CDS:1 n=1 Tax=Dentiscutata erythropus TaxID=1348616 RepID=A0A9N9JI47_9GLOM|nr:2269_t:CDS:2 [Dentiscutata erythropus]